MITTLTAARLQDEGKFDLSKPVSDYIPEMSQNYYKFSVSQLGFQVAGLPTEASPAGKVPVGSLKTFVPTFMNEKLLYYPGSYFLRSELGIDLMAYALEKNSNKAFTKLVQETMLDTLKLTNTVPDNPYRIVDNKVNMYDFDFISQPIVSNQIDLRGKEASAGYLSSVLDLVKIGNVLVYPGYLKQETLDFITKPYTLSEGGDTQYGFGFIVAKDSNGEIFYGQRGSVDGGCAALLVYPEDKLVIAMTSNIGGSTTDLPVFDVARIFKEQLHPERAQKEEAKK